MANRQAIYTTIAAICAAVSTLASTTNVLLIWDMGIWNGHTLLLFAMSMYQLIYDISFYSSCTAPLGSPEYIWARAFQDWGGTAPTIVCNVIAFSIIYILLKNKQLDIKRNFFAINVVTNAPVVLIIVLFGVGLAYPATNLVNVSNLVYYSIRLFSIFINFGTYFYTWSLIRDSKRDAYCCINGGCFQTSSSSTRSNPVNSPQAQWALKVLVSRLKYYPLVQAISRSGRAWYELQYGFDISNIDGTEEKFLLQVISAALVPFVSVGFLAIYLYMQPYAYEHFKRRLLSGKRLLSPSNIMRTINNQVRTVIKYHVDIAADANSPITTAINPDDRDSDYSSQYYSQHGYTILDETELYHILEATNTTTNTNAQPASVTELARSQGYHSSQFSFTSAGSDANNVLNRPKTLAMKEHSYSTESPTFASSDRDSSFSVNYDG